MQELETIKKYYKERYSTQDVNKGYDDNRKAIRQASIHLKELVEEAASPSKHREKNLTAS